MAIVFLDWIDLEAMNLIMRPRPALTNQNLEDEGWWQDWKKLRARIEVAARETAPQT